MEILLEFFLNTPGNSSFNLIDLWNIHMVIFQYPMAIPRPQSPLFEFLWY